MNKKKIIISFYALISFFLLNCKSYMHSVLENTTGLNLKEGISICSGLPVVDKFECKPSGYGWQKVNMITLDLTDFIRRNQIDLDSGEGRIKVIQKIYNQYILFAKDEVSLNACHRVDIFSSELYNPNDASKLKHVDQSHNVNIFAQVYSEVAISRAEALLEVYIKKENASLLDIKFKTKFRSSLRENISKNLKSSGKLLYVILNFSNSGLPNDTSILNNKEFSQCLNQINKGKEIIIGIAGIVLAGFKNESEVFNKTWFETAFDTAFEGELPKEVQDLKTIAAISWANQVNTDIQFRMNLLSAADFFYPTWILTTKQPFWKILLLN